MSRSDQDMRAVHDVLTDIREVLYEIRDALSDSNSQILSHLSSLQAKGGPPAAAQVRYSPQEVAEFELAARKHTCPDCSEPMVFRKNKTNGEAFFGCRDYPTCKGTRQADGTVRVKPSEKPVRGYAKTAQPSSFGSLRPQKSFEADALSYAPFDDEDDIPF